jgi:hypothetical protein
MSRSGQFLTLMNAVAVQRLVVLVSLEEKMHVAIPGESDPAVQLHRSPRDKRCRIAGGALRHARRHFDVGLPLVDRAGGVVKM